MNKCLPLLLVFLLFSVATYGQEKTKNPNSNGNEDGGKVNLLLPHGNIGINTLSPSERLEVIGNARISDKLFVNFIEVANLSATTIAVDEDLQVGRHVLVNGNIGIGVRVPSERLDIDGNLKVSQGIFADAIETNSLETNSFFSVNGTFSQHLSVTELFTVDGLTGLGIASPVERLEVAGNIKATENLMATGLQVQTGSFSSSVAISENLTINGNTGLGVATPAERLEVEGNVRVNNGIFTQTLEGSSFSMEEGTVNTLLTVNGNSVVQGNMGIGNASPAEKLEVNGNIKATGDFMGRNLEVEQGDFSGNATIGQNLAVTGTAAFTGAANMSSLTVSDNLQSNTLQASSAHVDGPLAVGGDAILSGNTGMGVEAPAERLEVEGNVRVSNTLFATTVESAGIALENATIANQLEVGGNTLVAGNVGIGNTAPTEKLDVTGNIKASENIISNSIQAQTADFSSSVAVNENLHVNGNTGLGVASPSEKLDVAGSIKASGELLGQSLTVREGSFNTNVQVGQNLAVAGDANFTGNVAINNVNVSSSLQSNSIQAGSGDFTGSLSAGGIVSLDSTLFVNGQIGVGTDRIEGYMLSVGGKIRAAGDIRVYPSAEWADYVFADTYYLRPLQEVAAYIEQNHHLPEIPSAAEVEKEGVELGAMDARLLQKIEELTLYVIQLEKENKEVKAEKEQLASQLEELRADVESIKESLGIKK